MNLDGCASSRAAIMSDDSTAHSVDETLRPNLASTNYVSPSFIVAIDPVALVVTECITVTSAMRKHARWAHSSVSAILGGGAREGNGKHGGRSAVSLVDDEGSRWGRGTKKGSVMDNPLMAGFARLRWELKGCKGAYLPNVDGIDLRIWNRWY